MQIGGQELRAGDYGREETASWFIFTRFSETLNIIMDTVLRSQAKKLSQCHYLVGFFILSIIYIAFQ